MIDFISLLLGSLMSAFFLAFFGALYFYRQMRFWRGYAITLEESIERIRPGEEIGE